MTFPQDHPVHESDELPLSVVLGLPFHRTTMKQALDDCERFMSGNQPRYLVTPNVDITRLAAGDARLRRILFAADRVICDGLPLVWLSKRLRVPLPERVAGSDLTPQLLERCAASGRSVYFFGSDEATLENASAVLREHHPDLTIAGWASPPLAPMDEWDNAGYVESIRAAAPDLLLVALGCPKQEYWIENFQRQCGVPLAMGIGASLDFIAGKQKRAPRWMQKVGLEWFWRFAGAPRRLGGRYAADFRFLFGHGAQVQRAGTQVLLLPEMRGSKPGERVTDCAAVVQPAADFLGVLAERWRRAHAAGESMTLKRVSPTVAAQLERFGWHELMQPTLAAEPAAPAKADSSAAATETANA